MDDKAVTSEDCFQDMKQKDVSLCWKRGYFGAMPDAKVRVGGASRAELWAPREGLELASTPRTLI
jgi:hypothetical protein